MPNLRDRRALLAIMGVPRLGPVTLGRVLADFGRPVGLSRFFDLPAEELTRRFRLHPASVEAVCERRAWLLAEAADLERDLRERDVSWLVANEAVPALRSPARLAQSPWSPPPVLFTRGNEYLMDLPAVGFLNSSDAPPRALDLTDALADRLAARGFAVVSGHNTAGYKAAAVAAARHGSPRLLVLDRGLISAPDDAFNREPVAPARVWSPEWDGLAGLAVSPFRPRDGWARSNSRRRDELVAAMATAIVAVHVRPGGVMESITRAALKCGMWVGVWDDGRGDGAALLPAQGRGNAVALAASAGLDEAAERLAGAVLQRGSADAAHAREGRAARRWEDRERHFLYSLLEAESGRTLDLDQFLDFADASRPAAQAPALPAAAAGAVCDIQGTRDPRPGLERTLAGLRAGGWLAALVDSAALEAESGTALRGWLAQQGWVAATVLLPARPDQPAGMALLLHKGGDRDRPVLAVTADRTATDAGAHHRYLAEARARIQAHLSRPR